MAPRLCWADSILLGSLLSTGLFVGSRYGYWPFLDLEVLVCSFLVYFFARIVPMNVAAPPPAAAPGISAITAALLIDIDLVVLIFCGWLHGSAGVLAVSVPMAFCQAMPR